MLLLFIGMDGQSNVKKDSIFIEKDTFSLPISNSDIDSKIEYQANDSIIYDIQGKKMILFNESKIKYTDMLIQSYFIEYDWTTGLLSANQYKLREDSIIGRPYMRQNEKDYFTDKLLYNFKSKKGKVYDIVTKESDALLHGHEVKKDSWGNWFISKAKYTTCDLEHPHFYFNASKLKLTSKKTIVTGPTNLVVNDVQTPIYLPFGIYPAKSGRRTGIIFPQQYGFSPFFNLQGMGIYLAINDYIDAKLLADVYFNGSYKFTGNMRYNKLYKFDGEFSATTHRIFNGDADNPIVRESTPSNYLFTWRHTQSPKAHPTFTFNTNLTYATQGAYNQSLTLNQTRLTSQISSSLTATKRFRKLPLLINTGISYTQDLASKTVSGYLPNLRINYNGNILNNPNKQRAISIGLQYSTEAVANMNRIADSQIFNGDLFNQLSYGVKHTAIFNFQNIKLFKYFSLIPNLSYYDRFFFKSMNIEQVGSSYDTVIQNGFYTARNFNTGLSVNTILIGMLPVSKKGIIQGIRHQMTPSINFVYTPDFGTDFWNYFGTVRDVNNNEKKYFKYIGPYNDIQSNASALINFSISNALEGKFRNRKDSILGTKKMMLIDAFTLSGNYNLISDSFNLSDIFMGFSNSTLRFLTFSGSMQFSPYSYVNGTRINQYKVSAGDGILRFSNMNATANFHINSNDFSKRALNSVKGNEYERNFVYRNYYYFYDFNSPWNLSMSININMNHGFTTNKLADSMMTSASILLNNFDFNLTPKWKIGISSGYDFNTNQIGLTTMSVIRDMHCWEFRVNYTPISNIGQAYTIEIRPKSALLQDLKLSRNKPAIENFF